jgi:hypothetical protein
MEGASTWKRRRSAGRVSERPNPSVPSEVHGPGTNGAIWSGTAIDLRSQLRASEGDLGSRHGYIPSTIIGVHFSWAEASVVVMATMDRP